MRRLIGQLNMVQDKAEEYRSKRTCRRDCNRNSSGSASRESVANTRQSSDEEPSVDKIMFKKLLIVFINVQAHAFNQLFAHPQ